MAKGKQKRRERAKRMVDFGMEEAEITYELGSQPSKEEIQAMRSELGISKQGESKQVDQSE